jgi:hypothetical protein
LSKVETDFKFFLYESEQEKGSSKKQGPGYFFILATQLNLFLATKTDWKKSQVYRRFTSLKGVGSPALG